MSFQPVIPTSGYVGWRFLSNTLESQKAAFVESGPVTRPAEYFRENIDKVGSAADLVADRQLLSVALGAFGLDEDIGNTFFVRTILEEGSFDDAALANRLSDKRYLEFAEAFGFGDLGGAGRTQLTGFTDEILSRYEDRQFERAVGTQDDLMRQSLNLAPAMADVLDRTSSDDARWFSIMGNPPLRSVFEGALGMPEGFGSLDIDRQLEEFRDRAESVLGTSDAADFADPEIQEDIIRLFLVRQEAASFGPTSGGAVALTLLQSAPTLFKPL